MPIEQSGNVTPGHLASWITTGVLGDGGALPTAQQVLGKLLSADFNDTADQLIAYRDGIQAFQLTGIVITNSNVSLTTAAGGFYPQAGKAGTPIVAATQVYSTLTAPTKLLQATLASYGSTTLFSIVNLPDAGIYFSLTTAQGSAGVADIYLIGMVLTP